MKTLMLVSLLSLAPAFAQAAPIHCSIHENDDRYVGVRIDPASSHPVVIEGWESALMADKLDVTQRGNTYAVVGRRVEAFAEGEEWVSVLDALVVYNPEKRSANLTYFTDGELNVAGLELKCR